MSDPTILMPNKSRDDYRVFYVTSRGCEADHLFSWFHKALNCQRDIFALLAYENSRLKYFGGRNCSEKPSLIPFTEFLNDMGMTYSATGDCYSYSACQMPDLLRIDRYKNIPVVNLIRHPVVWLEFYVRWCTTHMRMGVIDSLDWEWKTACHTYFEYLSLPGYTKDEIDIWASYQGMLQLNNILSDVHAVQHHFAIEKIAEEPDAFRTLVTYLTQGKVTLDHAGMDNAYSMLPTLFRGKASVECDPGKLVQTWPNWKTEAFRKLVSPKAICAYKSLGYDLENFTQRPANITPTHNRMQRPIFVSSLPKSGTWLLREILKMATGLEAHEPPIGSGLPAYEDETLIEFPSGTFFSWHSSLTSRSVSLLKSCQSRNIFLIRNIYDVLLSMLNHLSRDVDAAIGRSVIGSSYFKDKTTEQSLTLMISGFTSPLMTWMGAGPLLKQIDSMLDLVASGEALLLDYEQLTSNKRQTLERISRFLEYPLPAKKIREIIAQTEKDTMRERLKKVGLDQHITSQEHVLQRKSFLPYHKEMVDLAVVVYAPRLPERLRALGLDSILHLEAETKTVEEKHGSKWSRLLRR